MESFNNQDLSRRRVVILDLSSSEKFYFERLRNNSHIGHLGGNNYIMTKS